MSLQILQWDPFTADSESLQSYHSLISVAWAHEAPEDPPLDYETAIGRLLNPPSEEGDTLHWLAYQGSDLSGFAMVTLGVRENRRNAQVEVWIHPARRRQGIGTALIREMLPTISDGGYSTVIGMPVKPESAGAAWTRELGCHVTYRSAIQALTVSSAASALWDVPVRPGYELVRWVGLTPEELLESFAAARPAIEDAPQGDGSYRFTAWTAERVRENELEQLEQGVEDRVVAAVDSETGEVAGLTILRFYPGIRHRAYQDDTVVTLPHRGRGLGRAMKAAMMRWTVAERPDLQRVVTSTSADNKYMMEVNRAIGYQMVRELNRTEIALDALKQSVAT